MTRSRSIGAARSVGDGRTVRAVRACRTFRALGTAAVALVVAALLVACGVPKGGPATVVTRVPPGLLATAPTPTASPTTPAVEGPFVYFVNSENRLVPVEAGVPSDELTTPADAAAMVLKRLADGPGESERVSGLSTVLGPEAKLQLSSIEVGHALVEVETGEPAPPVGRLPLGVGQIVLSLTSIPRIDSVTLTSGGIPVDAPLPDGVLTNRALTATDYQSLRGRG